MFDGPYSGNSEFANLRGYLSNFSYFQMSESEKVLLRNAQYLREDIGQSEVMFTSVLFLFLAWHSFSSLSLCWHFLTSVRSGGYFVKEMFLWILFWNLKCCKKKFCAGRCFAYRQQWQALSRTQRNFEAALPRLQGNEIQEKPSGHLWWCKWVWSWPHAGTGLWPWQVGIKIKIFTMMFRK